MPAELKDLPSGIIVAETSDVTQGIAAETREALQKPRAGIALCLSGGGYRAALFQSGAVRRLNELGILGQITDISSVSGGSIFAAYLAQQIAALQDRFTDYESAVAAPFRQFCKNDIRTSSTLARLLPWEWGNGGAQAEALDAKYDRLLTQGKTLADLPARPTFHF